MKLYETMRDDENLGWCKPYVSACGYGMVVKDGEIIEASEEDWIGSDAEKILEEYQLVETGCKNCPWKNQCDAVNDEVMVASIKVYGSNATIFVNNPSGPEHLDIDLTKDANCDFTLEENLEAAKRQMYEFFGSNLEIPEDVIQTLKIYLSPVSSD